ncbi:FAD-binding oxidoreductase [Pontibacter qinzhouensis]|uniref:FAD-binding oxidoreductase n=1 Tax=Pontibacter qinzhouensis TaxID=2603253 RepID=A0A5C8J7M9_9BACT|nr:PepSY domain-containing protein [Pontibacter qinzhouensis]TXK33296.1 FAD-binding oxidoreductase [Pontibacter qinzhouensis]
MTISVWRYSHLALAVSSFVFIVLAALTGIILAFEPVATKLPGYRVQEFEELNLAQTITVLKKQYPELIELSVDANQFVTVKGTDADGNDVQAYVNPRNGHILGVVQQQSEFFQWVTAFHRSLFLKETGRFFIGLTSFLLLLIAVSGTFLILQRQRGLKRFFGRIVKDNVAQYYHVVLGRLSLIPIILIAVTGTYLSVSRFGLLPDEKVQHNVDLDAIASEPEKPAADFPVFQATALAQVQTVEFPFSDFPEDYYTLKLKDRELVVNQFTGDILSEVPYPATTLFTNLSLDLHTGRGSIIWSIVLAIASGNILFFVYSGFVITWKRLSGRVKNKYSAAESQFILLVGSENGSTYHYANAVFRQLLQQGHKAYLANLNSYQAFPEASHFIILTATYGLGEAPTDAAKFVSQLEGVEQQQPVSFSVLGFGSYAYPDFCKFAFEVHQLLLNQRWASPLIDVHTVNDKSPEDFSRWAEAWSQQTGIVVGLSEDLAGAAPKALKTLTVTVNTPAGTDGHTFLLRLKARGRTKVKSGDLLGIYPANDHRERLYSVGVIGNEIQLSVRLYPNGLGSAFLHALAPGQQIRAKLLQNQHFHFPVKAPQVILISNGTGIAPFLGMIDENKQKTPVRLYCGFRESASVRIYSQFLEEQQKAGKLSELKVALSREGKKQYVCDLLQEDEQAMAQALEQGGVLMLCGSLAMQKDVLQLLDSACQKYLPHDISFYQSRSQVLMDCY